MLIVYFTGESFTALEDRVEERTAELKSALSELQSTQAQMVQSEKMSSLGQLVAGVAYKINNPMNFIHGNITYLQLPPSTKFVQQSKSNTPYLQCLFSCFDKFIFWKSLILH